VRERINELRLDVRVIADRCGVSHPTVYAWRNGERDVPFHLWPVLERELGVEFGTLAELAGVHPGAKKTKAQPTRAYERVLDDADDAIRRLRDALLGRES
jgi:hypothetical protein